MAVKIAAPHSNEVRRMGRCAAAEKLISENIPAIIPVAAQNMIVGTLMMPGGVMHNRYAVSPTVSNTENTAHRARGMYPSGDPSKPK
jgi:hypothetical protein